MAVKQTARCQVFPFSAGSTEAPQTFWSNEITSKNRLYFGDNLGVLKHLCQQDSIRGHVQLVYIDPPYNVGGYFETRDFRHAYSDSMSVQNYLQFMKLRLELIYDILASNGSIYVHLDSNMVFHVKVLLDEIFGISGFQGMITRKKCKPKNYTKKTFGNISDYILYYTKSDVPVWNRPYDEWPDEKIQKEYPFLEEGTGRRYKRVPLHAPGVRHGESGTPWRGILPPPGKHWQYVPSTLEEMDKRGEIYWSSNGNPRRKVYFDQSLGIPVQDIWLDFLDSDNQNTRITGYPTEKNPNLLRRIIEASSNPGDMVLDCFAGSGTTLSVAAELGRNWIGVDSSDTAITTILNRFQNGCLRLQDFDRKTKQSTQLLPLFEEPSNQNVYSNTTNKPEINFTFYSTETVPEDIMDKLIQICGEPSCRLSVSQD